MLTLTLYCGMLTLSCGKTLTSSLSVSWCFVCYGIAFANVDCFLFSHNVYVQAVALSTYCKELCFCNAFVSLYDLMDCAVMCWWFLCGSCCSNPYHLPDWAVEI